MNNNIFRCRKCGRYAIAEELSEHQCRSLIDYKIEDNKIKVFDGFFWYLLKINHEELKSQQPKSNTEKTADDETEPEFAIVLYYAQRKFRYNGICLRCFTSSQARQRS